MKGGGTLLGLAVLVALGTYVLVYDEPEDAPVESAGGRVFGSLEADAIDQLTLRTSDGSEARIERGGSGWRIVAPIDAVADDGVVDGLVQTLASLDSEAVYDEIEALASYGLDGAPELRFRSKAGTGSPGERALNLGATAPVGGARYVTDGSGSQVWLVAAWRLDSFERSLFELREKRVVPVDTAAVDSVDVAWPGGAVALRRVEGDGPVEWRIEHPLELRARAETVRELLADLSFLRAEAFVDEPAPEQTASFATPEYRVELSTASDDEGLVFEVGAGGSPGRRLVRGPSGVVVEVSEATLADLPRSVGAFRFRELARFVPSEVERFSLAFGGEAAALVASRTEAGDWSFEGEALAPGAASRLLGALSRLEADEIGAESMGPAELEGLRLAPPVLRIQAFGEAGPLADVSIGAVRGDGAVAARTEGKETVFWLSPDVGADLPLSRDAFDASFRAEEGDAEPAPGPEAEDSAADAPVP